MSALAFVLGLLAGVLEALLLARMALGKARGFGAALRIGVVALALLGAAVLGELALAVLGWLLGLGASAAWLLRRWW